MLDIRLVNGSGPYEGRLEIHHKGEWGTVCDDGFSIESADVACRQLGYKKGALSYLKHAAFGRGDGKIWLDDMKCTGEEERLLDCSASTVEKIDCSHDEDVSIICQGGF